MASGGLENAVTIEHAVLQLLVEFVITAIENLNCMAVSG